MQASTVADNREWREPWRTSECFATRGFQVDAVGAEIAVCRLESSQLILKIGDPAGHVVRFTIVHTDFNVVDVDCHNYLTIERLEKSYGGLAVTLTRGTELLHYRVSIPGARRDCV
jgi:hypothetical protein